MGPVGTTLEIVDQVKHNLAKKKGILEKSRRRNMFVMKAAHLTLKSCLPRNQLKNYQYYLHSCCTLLKVGDSSDATGSVDSRVTISFKGDGKSSMTITGLSIFIAHHHHHPQSPLSIDTDNSVYITLLLVWTKLL